MAAALIAITFTAAPAENAALAKAMEKTFALEKTDGFYHQKIVSTRWEYGDSHQGRESQEWFAEFWTNGTSARFDFDYGTSGFTSTLLPEDYKGTCYFSNTPTDPAPGHDTECNDELFMSHAPGSVPLTAENTLNVQNVTLESANDTHGDLYFTWQSDNDQSASGMIISPNGYDGNSFVGAYSWKNDDGSYTNRVTLWEDSLKGFIDGYPYVILQIRLDGKQSAAYRIDLRTLEVTTLSDENLDAYRKTFQEMGEEFIRGVETLHTAYQQNFSRALEMQRYIDEQRIVPSSIQNTLANKILTYQLTGPEIQDSYGTPAILAIYTISQNTGAITAFEVQSTSGERLEFSRVVESTKVPTAPKHFFTIDSWKAELKARK